MIARSKRTNKPEAVKNDLLNAAGHILVTGGIQAFTLELVAKEARVSKGGLLHHFPNKKALLDGLFMREMDIFRQEMLASQQKDPVAAGRAARAYIGLNQENEAETPVILRHLLAAMLIDPQLGQEWIRHYWDVIRSTGLFEEMTPTLLLACMAADGLSLWDILGADILDQKMRQGLSGLMENSRICQKKSRDMLGYVYIFFAVLSEIIATMAQKEALGFTRLLPTLIMAAGYGASFVFLALSLRLVPMGIVYAGSAGLSIILANLAGWIYFRDQLGGHQAIGILLILVGISVVATQS